ncbi:MAG: arsenical pump-driving ATPase, partial [Leptospirillia bacterium]
EAAHLQDDLRRAGIEPWSWIVNQSVLAAVTESPLLRQRAANEIPEIYAVRTRHAHRSCVVSLMSEEPVGVERLALLLQ